jgi:hypothetical protein
MLRTILFAFRLTGVALALMLVFGSVRPAQAQNSFVPECPPSSNPLCLDNNYFLTGDYVVGGVGLRGLGGANGFATGTISIPDCVQAQAMSAATVNCASLPAPVPAGADIVAAFLYWETVESTAQLPPHPGQNGYFKPLGQAGDGYSITGSGYPITGTILGNPNAPTSWSSGGCSGSSQGAKSIVAYRADVRPYLLQDANGNLQANGSFQVMLADSGSNGGATPLTLGASLVIIYRVLSSAMPLNAILLYDGAFAPSNQTTSSEMSLTMQGFYDAAAAPVKLTHIVGDGQSNKNEQAFFQGNSLPFYPAHPNVSFPGIYNGSWDNVTWTINPGLTSKAFSATTSVMPGSSGGGCVDWGAVIFSTQVENSDGDGLLDAWKTGGGYTDVISVQNNLANTTVSLSGANPHPNSPKVQDIFVEIDYLTDLDGSTGLPKHSHLPKQQALDMVGDVFAKQNIHAHFDVGTNYNGVAFCKLTPALPGQAVCPDPYIIQGGTGGNAIPESAALCTDSGTLCQFPTIPSIGWKAGYLFAKNTATTPDTNLPLGNFQFGRKDSYHYVLFGHALGSARSFWTTFGVTLQDPSVAKLISISNSTLGGGATFLVTIQTPQGIQTSQGLQGIIYPPGSTYCPNAGNPACSDNNFDRVTVSGAIGQSALNGTYKFTNASSQGPDANGVITTTFQITITTGLPSGAQTYDFNNESRLTVEYLGPSSTSGHSDFPGGGDSAVTFGLWSVDDPSGCQADPSVPLNPGQTYCDDETGTIQAQAGTLLHEMGHTLALAHGGIFYPTGPNPNGTRLPGGQQVNGDPDFEPAAFGLNCNPAILSSMNYLFQIRGFPEPLGLMLQDGNAGHPIDYSGQTLPALDETKLNEITGIGVDLFTSSLAAHFTRWYGPPTTFQTMIGQNSTFHCDGTPVASNEPLAIRINGTTSSAPIDWNNDADPNPNTDLQPIPFQDVNFDGSTSASPDPGLAQFNDMQGFNDWVNLDLRQIASRENAVGFSGSGGVVTGLGKGGGGVVTGLGKGGGGAVNYPEAGGVVTGLGKGGGGVVTGLGKGGGGVGGDEDVQTACSTADPPLSLSAAVGTKSVILNWQAPGGPCKVNTYTVWRSTDGGPFVPFPPLGRRGSGTTTTAPPTTFTDDTVKHPHTYTYFVTDKDAQGAASNGSNSVTVTL